MARCGASAVLPATKTGRGSSANTSRKTPHRRNRRTTRAHRHGKCGTRSIAPPPERPQRLAGPRETMRASARPGKMAPRCTHRLTLAQRPSPRAAAARPHRRPSPRHRPAWLLMKSDDVFMSVSYASHSFTRSLLTPRSTPRDRMRPRHPTSHNTAQCKLPSHRPSPTLSMILNIPHRPTQSSPPLAPHAGVHICGISHQ